MGKGSYNHVLLAIFKIPRALGWFPFDGKFRLSEKSLFYCFLVGFVMFMIHRSLRLSSLEQGNHPVIILFNGLSIICNVISYVIPVFWLIRRRRTVYNFIKNINKLINKCPNVRFKRNRPRYINLLITPPLLFSCYTCKFSKKWYNVLRHFQSFISFYYGISFISQFLEVVHLLQYILRHENKLEDADSSTIFKCFMILQQVDRGVYKPSIFLLTTQHFIQIISYLFIALVLQPQNLDFVKTRLVFDLIHNIIPLMTIICSYDLVKAQAQTFKEKLIKKMIEGGYCKCLKKEGLELSANGDSEVFSGNGFFTLDNSLVIAVASSAVIIALQFCAPEEITSYFINYSRSIF